MRNKKDVFGKPLVVGDVVMWADRYKELHISNIERFANIKVSLEKGPWVYPNNLILLNEQQIKEFINK